MLIYVLKHPEDGANIGTLQEDCPDLSGAAQHTKGQERSEVARNVVEDQRNAQPRCEPLGNCCSIHLSYGGVSNPIATALV